MREQLAKLICPDLKHNKDYYLNLYKPRDSKMITRFAPSPTGFLHTGSLYMALINYKLADDNDGIFYLRIEDTDTKREVSGSMDTIIKMLNEFGIEFNSDEAYGPYIQSQRADIYNAFIYDLIINDKAYPDFASKEELDSIREYQEKNNLRIGYYKEYAKYRELSVEEQIKRILNNEPYVVRLKSNGDFNNTFKFIDELRGEIEFHENDFDVVIRKSDGLPTYHFAHAIDDTLMHTTLVIRGEEWLNSIPTHYDLFKTLGFDIPKYMHLSSILKASSDGSHRKLSKRKDPEASVEFLLEQGYPKKAFIDYLLILANSKYEESMNDDYKLDPKNFSITGSTFDILKLENISKEYIHSLDIDSLIKEIMEYASKYNKELFNIIVKDIDYFKSIMDLEHFPTPRKDYAKYSEILDKIFYFYDELFDNVTYEEITMDKDTLDSVINVLNSMDNSLSEDLWLASLKDSASLLGFAKNKKDMEKNNLKYMFADLMKVLRIALCKKNESFSLYEVIRILGENRVKERINKL